MIVRLVHPFSPGLAHYLLASSRLRCFCGAVVGQRIERRDRAPDDALPDAVAEAVSRTDQVLRLGVTSAAEVRAADAAAIANRDDFENTLDRLRALMAHADVEDCSELAHALEAFYASESGRYLVDDVRVTPLGRELLRVLVDGCGARLVRPERNDAEAWA